MSTARGRDVGGAQGINPEELNVWLAALRWSPAVLAEALAIGTDREIGRWLAGSAPVPEWVASRLRGLVRSHIEDLPRPPPRP